jgi:hypothetical protein
MSNRVAVVDGANIAYEELTADGKPRVANLVAVRDALEKLGFDPIVMVDAALRHSVDDPRQLEGLLDKQLVLQAPAGTDADYFVLRTAQQQDGIVVSNDRFEDRRQEFPWLEQRRVPFMIVEGQVQLYRDRLPPHAGR